MKIKRKDTKVTKIIISSIAAITILVGGYLAYAIYANIWPFDSSSQTKNTTTTEKNSDSDGTTDSQSQDSKYDPQGKKEFLDKTYGTDKSDEVSNSTPTGSIFSEDDIAMKTSVSGNSLIVKTILMNINSGECTVKLSQGSILSTEQADIMYAPDHSSCKGFALDITKFKPGDAKLSLTITSKGSSITKVNAIEL